MIINKSMYKGIFFYVNSKISFDWMVKHIRNFDFTNSIFILTDNFIIDKLHVTTHINDLMEELNLYLIDEIIVLYHKHDIFDKNLYALFKPLYKSLLFFSKEKYPFINKDILRVPHIWKDVEWGKRKKNYHPLGKDIGNVWIKEYAKAGKIFKHECFTLEEIISNVILSQYQNLNDEFLILIPKSLELKKEKIYKMLNEKIAINPKSIEYMEF